MGKVPTSSQIYTQRLFIALFCINVNSIRTSVFHWIVWKWLSHIRKIKLVFVFNPLELVATSFFVMYDFFCVTCLGYSYLIFWCLVIYVSKQCQSFPKKNKNKTPKSSPARCQSTLHSENGGCQDVSTRHLRPLI